MMQLDRDSLRVPSLAALVSLPAFCAGHLWREGASEVALKVTLMSALVAVVAALLAHHSRCRSLPPR